MELSGAPFRFDLHVPLIWNHVIIGRRVPWSPPFSLFELFFNCRERVPPPAGVQVPVGLRPGRARDTSWAGQTVSVGEIETPKESPHSNRVPTFAFPRLY